VTIVCWGDSVTHGGDASVPEKKYVNVFKTGLEKRFPAADIRVVNISVGGSNSRQWLYPQEYPFSRKNRQKQLNFNRILDEKPDLVTIEFVNDSRLSAKEQNKVYQDIFTQLDAIQAEIILITPHFTHPDWMGFSHLRESENRDYVHALNYFATKYHTGIADASTRWQNLWKQGIPYLTLLHNSVNHPDDRGHLIFAEELWKCFQ
jgi:lysophospholipase L1-like esterase